MRPKSILLTLLVLMAAFLTVPLGAQLQEAIKVSWPGFQVLRGLWQDRNGMGVMQIKKINPTGGIEIQYSELEPVHVTQAQAARDGKTTKVLISLRYSNSSYSTYDLTYNPQSDQLKGIFWRKGSFKTTEVVFDRLGPKP
jgi:hypothetical protein